MIKYLLEDDLVMVRALMAQSSEYFGRKVTVDLVATVQSLMVGAPERQSFLGYVERGRLTCMLGQRISLRSPTWIENFVFLDKKKARGIYDLAATHFLEVLDFAIEVAETDHRHSFLTALDNGQITARLSAMKRGLRHYGPQHRLRSYVPSFWYHSQQGNYADAEVLVGNSTSSTVLQWVKPLNKEMAHEYHNGKNTRS